MGKQQRAGALSITGITNFAELVARRPAIFGEDPGSYEMFQAQLIQTLAPVDQYEYALAAEIVDISWEIIQARHVKTTQMRITLTDKISDAVFEHFEDEYRHQFNVDWNAHFAAGGDKNSFKASVLKDEDSWLEQADDLAERATTLDKVTATQAHAELVALGIDPSVVLYEAYFDPSTRNKLDRLEERQKILERRRRELERDFRRLQHRRPIDGEATEL